MKNSKPFKKGFVVGFIISLLGYFIQLTPEKISSTNSFSVLLMDSLIFAGFVGILMGIGFSGMMGKANSHTNLPSDSNEYRDEADFREFMKKNPSPKKQQDKVEKHNKSLKQDK